MASSRYKNIPIISGSYYSTFDFPKIDLSKLHTFNIRTSTADRLDTLAFRYLGAGEYWWILAMINNYAWAFDFVPGEIMKVPTNVDDILRLI
jgi:hypothetical protein